MLYILWVSTIYTIIAPYRVISQLHLSIPSLHHPNTRQPPIFLLSLQDFSAWLSYGWNHTICSLFRSSSLTRNTQTSSVYLHGLIAHFLLYVLSHFSRAQLFATPWTVTSRQNTGVSHHAFLQVIFLTQGSNPRVLCLLHWQAGSLPLVQLNNIPLSGYIPQITHLLTEGHLGWFKGARLLYNMVKRMFNFRIKLSNWLLNRQYDFAFPPAKKRSSFSSTISPAFGAVSLLDLGHCNRCIVVSHFNLYFFDDIECGAYFHLYLPSVYLLWWDVH